MTFARLHEAQVTERVDTALEIPRGSAAALAWVMGLRDRVKVETAADMAVLANIAIGLSQLALEIERGRQSDLDPMVADGRATRRGGGRRHARAFRGDVEGRERRAAQLAHEEAGLMRRLILPPLLPLALFDRV